LYLNSFCRFFRRLFYIFLNYYGAPARDPARLFISRKRRMTQKNSGKAAAGKKPIRPRRKKLHKAILQAAEAAGREFGEAGLVSYLQAQAVATPSPFLSLLGKVLTEAEDKSLPPVRRIELVAAVAAPLPEQGGEEALPAGAELAAAAEEEGAAG